MTIHEDIETTGLDGLWKVKTFEHTGLMNPWTQLNKLVQATPSREGEACSMVAPLAAVGAEVAGCSSAQNMQSALQKKQAAWTLPEGDQRPLGLHALHKVLPQAPRPDGGGLLARTHRQSCMPALSLQHAMLRRASHPI